MNFARNTTSGRLFLTILFSFLTVVGSGSVACGDFVVAPRSTGPLSGGCFVPGTPVRRCAEPAMATVAAGSETTTIPTTVASSTTTVAIEDVALGSRVPDQNPRPEDYDFSLPDVDRDTWKQVDVRLRRRDGAVVEMQLLRPTEWIENQNLSVGSDFKLILLSLSMNTVGTPTSHDCFRQGTLKG